MPFYDLTHAISSSMVVFPGDPTFESKMVMDVNNDDPFTLRHFSLGNHAGTHIDFPAHVRSGGKTSDHFPIEYLTGIGKIINIPENSHVTASHVDAADIAPGNIVFFKTRNTRDSLYEKGVYTEDFKAIEPEAAKRLVERGIRIVGIDYLSVDPVEDENLTVHKTLLDEEVLIVENLNLQMIPAGRYYIRIAPLKIEGMDGLPVRVVADLASSV